MFRRLLVANRGEVAVRVAKTARRLGVQTVAIHSEADAGAPWLAAFDRAVAIGPAHPGKSYLDQDAVLQVAVQEDCQALHPGWGFLAENALFAARVRQLGIAWVGPPPRAIRLMGDKATARRTMAALGLPTIPGSEGILADADEARQLADGIGYPVLLKATAGGGGRGMRVARDPQQLAAAFAEAAREAQAAFGDPGLYLEKYVLNGRHIEFQVLACDWGRAVHLGERECSVQRRHQKLVEEAPSPALDPATREGLGARITAAMVELGYRGAGTLEFLKDPAGPLYFMEMNTRLQVEHPVTEMITGIDIVEHQLRIAANEDPAKGFQPNPGPIERFVVPLDRGPGIVRVDTHLAPPDHVPPFYDSLVAKVIAHGETREAARQTLRRALAATEVQGVPTTIPAHLAILDDPRFVSGVYDTSLLAAAAAE